MFSITIEGETFQEIRTKCAEFLATDVAHHAIPTHAVFQKEPEPVKDVPLNFDFDVKKKSTKKPKAKKADKVVEQETINMPIVEPTTVSRQEVQEALQEVNVSRGLPFARSILQKYGAEKMSDLKSEHYFSFVESCKQVSSEA